MHSGGFSLRAILKTLWMICWLTFILSSWFCELCKNDLTKWKFNEYKQSISETVDDGELAVLEMTAEFLKSSRDIQRWMKPQMDMALTDVKRRSGRL